MQTMSRIGLLLMLALFLAGCAGLLAPPPQPGELEQRQVIDLIQYAQHVAAMPAERQRFEYAASAKAFAQSADSGARMRLALLLGMPGASFHDSARAASLLEPMLAPDAKPGPMRSFAQLLYAQLNERASEQKRAKALREQLDVLKQSDRSSREKLDALKDVEHSLMQRAQASQSKSR